MVDVEQEQLRAWFEEYLEVCNRHDLTGIRELLHPDVRRAHLQRGVDAWLDDLDARFVAFPDLQWKRVAVVVEDDRLAAHLRLRGTHRGPFRGVAPTGRHVNLAEFVFLRVTAGRVVDRAGTEVDTELLRQLTA